MNSKVMLVAPFHASHSHTFPRVTGMYTILGTVARAISTTHLAARLRKWSPLSQNVSVAPRVERLAAAYWGDQSYVALSLRAGRPRGRPEAAVQGLCTSLVWRLQLYLVYKIHGIRYIIITFLLYCILGWQVILYYLFCCVFSLVFDSFCWCNNNRTDECILQRWTGGHFPKWGNEKIAW